MAPDPVGLGGDSLPPTPTSVPGGAGFGASDAPTTTASLATSSVEASSVWYRDVLDFAQYTQLNAAAYFVLFKNFDGRSGPSNGPQGLSARRLDEAEMFAQLTRRANREWEADRGKNLKGLSYIRFALLVLQFADQWADSPTPGAYQKTLLQLRDTLCTFRRH